MNTTPEVASILSHIKLEVKNTIENEMMCLSIGQLTALIMDYKAMQYKPSAEFTAIAESAEAELMYREARLHRIQVADSKVGA